MEGTAIPADKRAKVHIAGLNNPAFEQRCDRCHCVLVPNGDKSWEPGTAVAYFGRGHWSRLDPHEASDHNLYRACGLVSDADDCVMDHSSKHISKVHITVTEGHIRRGVPGNRWQCPLALAANDAGLRNPSVFTSALIMDETLLAQDSEGFLVWGVLPEEAKALTRAFHAGQHVEPLEFDITMKRIVP